MADRDETRPLGAVNPDERSLDFAEQVAASLGMPFDREKTRELGMRLYETMFADLVRVLELDLETPDFHSGIYPEARAFAAKTGAGRSAVALDMKFDFWVTSLAHLVGILTFSVPEPIEQRRITATIAGLFELYTNSAEFDRLRQRMATYYLDPRFGGKILNITHPLGRSMMVFILCHEIAHIRLGHLDRAGSPELELEADAEAAAYFQRVIEYGQRDRNTHIHVDPKVAGAPLIFSMILELFEAWLTVRGFDLEADRQHPPAAQRTAQLQRLMAEGLNDPALEITIGATHAIRGLHTLLGLPEPGVWRE